jgi:serine/threonine protein phosphatase PrpC
METSRISSAGLKVRDGRVQGNLAVSRAFGDFQYKKAENLGQIE